MYEQDKLSAAEHLVLLDEVKSPREKDGPRHVWPSRDGKLLYSVSRVFAYSRERVADVLPLHTDYGT
jgi:hypothetical protein